VIADLYLPRQLLGSSSPHSRPGIILALGVRVGPSAGQDIRHFADALSRLGYVVLWPRSSSLQSGSAMLEEPRTFVAAFRWLARQPAIDRHRVSYLGLSAGASEAFVAATDRRIARRVRALISIGAYYDLPAYLVSLATGRIRVGHREVVWNPARSLVAELTTILRRSHRTRVLQVFSARTEPDAIRRLARAGPRAERALRRLSPAVHVRAFHAPIFILHDRGDPVVPWVESLKLEHALPRKLVRDVYLSSVLQHVVPGRARWQSLPGEYWGLYSFMCDALAYL
jgi:acetyl esterase/lipase